MIGGASQLYYRTAWLASWACFARDLGAGNSFGIGRALGLTKFSSFDQVKALEQLECNKHFELHFAIWVSLSPSISLTPSFTMCKFGALRHLRNLNQIWTTLFHRFMFWLETRDPKPVAVNLQTSKHS